MQHSLLTVVTIAVFLFYGESMARNISVPVEFTTIQQGLDAAEKGDTVRVAAGTYYENIRLRQGVVLQGGWDKSFRKRDIARHLSIINGERRGGWVVFGANESVLDGFLVINGGNPSIDGGPEIGSGIHCKSTSPIIINNTIKGNNAAGIYCSNSSAIIMHNAISHNGKSGIYLEKGSSLTIRGNQISHNKMAGISVGSLPVSSMAAIGNIIHHNKRAGINGAWTTGSICNNIIYENEFSGIRCGVTPMSIINNTVTANKLAGVIATGTHGIPVIKNNIISRNGKTGIKSEGRGYSHNLLFANNKADTLYPDYMWYARLQFGGYDDELSYGIEHNIIANPLFVDAASHDYHLRAGSPAIDKGDPTLRFNDLNFYPSLGTARNDMGAYGGALTVPEQIGENDPPLARIGSVQQAYTGDTVLLDGGKSLDPNGDAITYIWQLADKPQTSKAEISELKVEKPVFTPDVQGEYRVRLIVSDRWGMASPPQTVTIDAIENRPPTVKIGRYVSEVNLGDTVSFIYEGIDPNDDPLRYTWELFFRPSTSNAVLANGDTDNPVLTVDSPGCYTVRLTANDGKVDSIPDSVHVCTMQGTADGRKNVPADYPTIQSAIDAASPGDEITVAKGIYKENIVIDKSVKLIGLDWPVIDGGTHETDVSTIFICYLDNMDTGKVEGFVIKGGGKGAFGHGIKILNSSPEVVNNQILGNGNVGLGIHGKEKYTGRTRVHRNFIYENIIGVGNGMGAAGRIYDNTIYSNKVAGIGVMGLSKPKIENNTIYGNYVGIGTRGVAFPKIVDNYIHDNNLGIAINPGTAAKIAAGDDSIYIKNNAVFSNRQCGIYVSSLNKNAILLQENNVTGNSDLDSRQIREGGVVHSFPPKAILGALLKGNVVTSNNGNNIQYHEEAPAPPD